MQDISNELQKLITELNDQKLGDWEPFVEELKKIYDADKEQRSDLKFGDYWLNAVCVGFARFFDESNITWRGNPIVFQRVKNLVQLAKTNLSINTPSFSKQSCGLHEDGACVMAPLGPRSLITKDKRHFSGTLIMQPTVAECFTSDPIPVILPIGAEIQRIIENPNKFIGPWWKTQHYLPASKLAWRADYAVLKKWNTDGWYMNSKQSINTPAWLGQAASQKVVWMDHNNHEINEKCILEGGETQIYLNPKDIKVTKKGITHW